MTFREFIFDNDLDDEEDPDQRQYHAAEKLRHMSHRFLYNMVGSPLGAAMQYAQGTGHGEPEHPRTGSWETPGSLLSIGSKYSGYGFTPSNYANRRYARGTGGTFSNYSLLPYSKWSATPAAETDYTKHFVKISQNPVVHAGVNYVEVVYKTDYSGDDIDNVVRHHAANDKSLRKLVANGTLDIHQSHIDELSDGNIRVTIPKVK